VINRLSAAAALVLVCAGCTTDRPAPTVETSRAPTPHSSRASTEPSGTRSATSAAEVPLSPSEAATPADVSLIGDVMAFAAAPDERSLERLSFAPSGVRLGLADLLGPPVDRDGLHQPERWLLDIDMFRGRAGPFSALETLAGWRGQTDALAVDELVVNVGPYPRCASPPGPPAPEVDHLRRVSVQPVGMPCLLWWSVDVYVTDGGEIAAVSLDLYEP
jgi:hypothetical protein